ncbi:MAG: tripartite tricarboxylate transporter TctB family protein [Methyloligellaceae bacterium]
MGKASTRDIVELAVWFAFAAFLFVFSFEFDQNIEIYKFGASAWPRGIILLIVIAALGNFYWHWRYGTEFQGHSIGAQAAESDSGSSDDDEESDSISYYKRMGLILLLPVVYATFMESIGFYTLTPFFIGAVIYLLGERNWIKILIISVVSYLFILLMFAKLLYVGLPVGTIHPFYDYSNWLLAFLQNN